LQQNVVVAIKIVAIDQISCSGGEEQAGEATTGEAGAT
jgi:hypothetical protein